VPPQVPAHRSCRSWAGPAARAVLWAHWPVAALARASHARGCTAPAADRRQRETRAAQCRSEQHARAPNQRRRGWLQPAATRTRKRRGASGACENPPLRKAWPAAHLPLRPQRVQHTARRRLGHQQPRRQGWPAVALAERHACDDRTAVRGAGHAFEIQGGAPLVLSSRFKKTVCVRREAPEAKI
jgi:hypothetical protein